MRDEEVIIPDRDTFVREGEELFPGGGRDWGAEYDRLTGGGGGEGNGDPGGRG